MAAWSSFFMYNLAPRLAQIAFKAASSPSAKNFTRKGIEIAAKGIEKGKSIWGVSAREIAELAKKGIKVKEYYRSGPNPGQR